MVPVMELLAALEARRTVKLFTGEAVPREILLELCRAAILAPNHRLTQPWRFGIADQPAIARLASLLRQPGFAVGGDPRKLESMAERLATCGGLIQVTCLLAGDAGQRQEDRDAAAAAVENLLLAAVARGLGTLWSTSSLFARPEVVRWFGADPQAESHVATVWVGRSGHQPPPPARKPLAEVVRWA